ncbi:MAG: PhnD/SsuA/transferrin family substrate-binding protein [Pseudomonadota bacterium]
MGPWGYVLANNEGGAQAVAMVKYDGKPVYYAIIVGKPGLGIKNWPADAKGKSISFADAARPRAGWCRPSGSSRTASIPRASSTIATARRTRPTSSPCQRPGRSRDRL